MTPRAQITKYVHSLFLLIIIHEGFISFDLAKYRQPYVILLKVLDADFISGCHRWSGKLSTVLNIGVFTFFECN